MKWLCTLLAGTLTHLACPPVRATENVSDDRPVTRCSARQLEDYRLRDDRVGMRYCVSGTVLSVMATEARRIIIEDDTGTTTLSYVLDNVTPDIRAGDAVTATGTITRINGENWLKFDTFTVTAHGSGPVPHDVSVADLKSGAFDRRLVRVTGVLRDVARDELDPEWTFLRFYAEGQAFYAYVIHSGSVRRSSG